VSCVGDSEEGRRICYEIATGDEKIKQSNIYWVGFRYMFDAPPPPRKPLITKGSFADPASLNVTTGRIQHRRGRHHAGPFD
jgi:hypothetical protein